MTGLEMICIEIQASVQYQPRCETINDRFRANVFFPASLPINLARNTLELQSSDITREITME